MYRIFRAEGSNTVYKLIDSSYDSTYIDKGLRSNTKYNYIIKTVKEIEGVEHVSKPSVSISVITPSAPVIQLTETYQLIGELLKAGEPKPLITPASLRTDDAITVSIGYNLGWD